MKRPSWNEVFCVRVLKKLEKILKYLKPKRQLKGKIMYIVKDDNEDVGYSVVIDGVTDAEGNTVDPSSVMVEVVSDNEAAVSVTPSESDRTGTIHFGAPGLANLNASVSDSNGNLLGSFGAQFTVTTGDPAAITGGSLSFEGLTEV